MGETHPWWQRLKEEAHSFRMKSVSEQTESRSFSSTGIVLGLRQCDRWECVSQAEAMKHFFFPSSWQTQAAVCVHQAVFVFELIWGHSELCQLPPAHLMRPELLQALGVRRPSSSGNPSHRSGEAPILFHLEP